MQLLAGWSLAALVGLDIRPGGGFEGLAIGAAAGLSYALTTSRADMGLAAPRGRHRVRLVAAMAIACGAAALLVTLTGRPLVGETIHRLAQASDGAQATLAPLGRFVGEPDFGPLSRSLIGTGEGAIFGLGVGLGLTRRPRRSR